MGMEMSNEMDCFVAGAPRNDELPDTTVTPTQPNPTDTQTIRHCERSVAIQRDKPSETAMSNLPTTNVTNTPEAPEQPLIEPNEMDNSKYGSGIAKKFANVRELEKAYERLHAEFTRKSQQLKKIQHDTAGAAICEPIIVEKRVVDDGAEEVIKNYLLSLEQKPVAPPVISGGGEFGYGIKPNPKSVRDTQKIAENYFKTKEIIIK
jgi:hypothetical protein